MTELSSDEAVETLFRQIKDNLKKSIRWHLKRGSAGSRDSLLDLAAKFEKQQFDRLIFKNDAEGQEAAAECWRVVRDDVLPEIVHDLRLEH